MSKENKILVLQGKILIVLRLMKEIYREKPRDEIRRKLDKILQYLSDALEITYKLGGAGG